VRGISDLWELWNWCVVVVPHVTEMFKDGK
jgi:hypothetical protein